MKQKLTSILISLNFCANYINSGSRSPDNGLSSMENRKFIEYLIFKERGFHLFFYLALPAVMLLCNRYAYISSLYI